jgi:hypothetical protein
MYQPVSYSVVLRSVQIAFVCFVRISEKKTAAFVLQNFNRFVFITETERVYCPVRTVFK